MMYSQANLKEAKKLVEILAEFTNPSGTEVNKDKTEIIFFNTPMVAQAFLARTMGFRIGKLPTKYLGVQMSDKQNKIVNWKGLIGKIQKRMDNWTFRTLNIPSRLIPLKSVLQAMPIYQMASQAIPKTICQKMVEIFKKFLWQGTSKTKKWALFSWTWLSKSVIEGGLGLRDPYILNQVMGAKLWWRWIQGGQDRWKSLWEKKYEMTRSPEGKLRNQ